MALRTWNASDTSAVQTDTITLGGTWENNDVVSITLTDESGNSYQLDTVTGSTVISTICTTVANAFNASTDPRFRVISATAGSTTITLTADTAGAPFYASVATTESGGGGADAQTISLAHTTLNQSPYDYNDTTNWVERAVPVAGDEVVIDGTYSILYGMRQGSVTIDSFTVLPTYSGTIGSEGSPLTIDITDSTGVLQLDGLGTYHIDIGNSAISPRISSTAAPQDGSYNTIEVDRLAYPAATLLGSGMVTVTASGGRLDIARQFGATATATTVQNSGATVTMGSGLSLTTYNQSGGIGLLRCSATNVNVDGGTLTTEGTGTVAAMTQNGGTTTSNSTGTITTATVIRGVLDFTQSHLARTVTNLYGGGTETAKIMMIPGVVTVTNQYGTPSTPGS